MNISVEKLLKNCSNIKLNFSFDFSFILLVQLVILCCVSPEELAKIESRHIHSRIQILNDLESFFDSTDSK